MRKIDNEFIIEYQITAHNELGKRSMGGTDELFAWRTAPSFYDILEITKARSIIEFGFNSGNASLMFLMINPSLVFHDVDIADNPKSNKYLKDTYRGWYFFLKDTKDIPDKVEEDGFNTHYDLVFLDADHSDEGVINDLEKCFLFNPEYVLLDDYRHGSHNIEKIVTENYKDRIEVVKVYEFNDIWKGYSMALCKVKY